MLILLSGLLSDALISETILTLDIHRYYKVGLLPATARRSTAINQQHYKIDKTTPGSSWFRNAAASYELLGFSIANLQCHVERFYELLVALMMLS